MDLRQRLTRWAMSRPSVLVVDSPGHAAPRIRLEAELARRAWPLATTPADADLLLVLGEPEPKLAPAIDVIWSQVPWPRWRHQVHPEHALDRQLDAALAALTDAALTIRPATHDPADMLAVAPDDGDSGEREEDHGQGGENGDGEHGGHGGHGGHGDSVAGLPMASTAADRDGLELDSLHVSLGPILPAWPTGLVLDGSLQGDVLTGTSIRWLGAPSVAPEDELPAGVVALDRMARFLDVAGWPAAAGQARRARHELASPGPASASAGRRRARWIADRVRRSATLRWSVRDIDGVLDRVYRWCELATSWHDGATPPVRDAPERGVSGPGTLDDLAGLVDGHELASVRLIVASIDVDHLRAPADKLTPSGLSTESGVAHG